MYRQRWIKSSLMPAPLTRLHCKRERRAWTALLRQYPRARLLIRVNLAGQRVAGIDAQVRERANNGLLLGLRSFGCDVAHDATLVARVEYALDRQFLVVGHVDALFLHP